MNCAASSDAPRRRQRCSNRSNTACRPLFRTTLPITTTAALLLVSCALVAGSGHSQAALELEQPIQQADLHLQQQGWQPAADGFATPLDRERAGNSLSSLSACSGTGAGFCRYDYRRGALRLEVITVPGPDGEGRVFRWSEHR